MLYNDSPSVMQVVDLNSNLSRTRFDFSDFQHKKYLSATNVALKLIYFIAYQQFEKLKKMKWTSQEKYQNGRMQWMGTTQMRLSSSRKKGQRAPLLS